MVHGIGYTACIPDRGLYVGSHRSPAHAPLAQATPARNEFPLGDLKKASGKTRNGLRAGAQEAVDLDLGPVPILFGTPTLEVTLYR